jgi:molybdenum cofactor cytidylyltransferase
MAGIMTEGKPDNRGHRIVAIVLAAGESTRFGRPKQLEDMHGEPMIARILTEVTAAEVDDVFVVVGHEAGKVRASLARFAGVQIVENPNYRSGLSTSVRAGLTAASNCDAAMFVLGDMPGITSETIHCVLTAYRASPSPLAAGMHRGRPVHPVIFRKDLWPELMQVTGDIGGREVVSRHLSDAVTVEMPDPACVADIDTPEDLTSTEGETRSE